MAEFPALPLFTDAYLGDTTHLTTIEHGAYLLLLMVAWRSRDCRLPDDDRLLARYTKTTTAQWRRLRPILEPFFVSENGQWMQRRLNDEHDHVRQVRESQVANGRASALKRKGRHSTKREPSVNEASTPSPSPTPNKKSVAKATSCAGEFPRPDWADEQVWRDFMANRKKRKATNSQTAYRGFLADVAKLSSAEWPPPRLLEHAAKKGWAGIYDPTERTGNGYHNDPRDPTVVALEILATQDRDRENAQAGGPDFHGSGDASGLDQRRH